MNEKPMQIGMFGCFSGANLGEQATLIAVAANLHRLAGSVCVRNFASGRFDKAHLAPRMIEGDYESAVKVEIPQRKFEDPPKATAVTTGWRAALKRIPQLVALVRTLRKSVTVLESIAREAHHLWKSWQQLRGVDLFLIVGSNQCFDFYGGPWNFPYRLLRWSALAKLAGAKLAFVSVGAGPVVSPLSKRMLRSALALADYRSFRDYVSRDVLSEFCPICAADPVVPDLVFSLPVDHVASAGGAGVTVGINTMAIFDDRYWPESDQRRYSQLLDAYAKLVRWIEQAGHRYFFYATNPRDVLVVHDVGKQLGKTSLEFTDPDIFPGDVAGLLRRISRAHVVVALRYHGIVLPYVVGRPTLALEYWGKTRDLAENMGQLEHFVSSQEFLPEGEGGEVDAVIAKLDKLIRERDRISHDVCRAANRNRDLLNGQYSDLITGYCRTA